MHKVNVVTASKTVMFALAERLISRYRIEGVELLGLSNEKDRNAFGFDSFDFMVEVIGDNAALISEGNLYGFELMLKNAPSGEYGIACAHGDKRNPEVVFYGYELEVYRGAGAPLPSTARKGAFDSFSLDECDALLRLKGWREEDLPFVDLLQLARAVALRRWAPFNGGQPFPRYLEAKSISEDGEEYGFHARFNGSAEAKWRCKQWIDSLLDWMEFLATLYTDDPWNEGYPWELEEAYAPHHGFVPPETFTRNMKEFYEFAREEDPWGIISSDGMHFLEPDCYDIKVLTPILDALAAYLPELEIITVDWEDESITLSESGSTDFVYQSIFSLS